MPEPLKNMYHPGFFESFTGLLAQSVPGFRKQAFLNQVFDNYWEERELKQRVRHISTTLHRSLPGNYRQQLQLVLNLVERLQEQGVRGGFEYMIFPDFIEQYGLSDLQASLDAMEVLTQFISCEFAIRPFLLQYPQEVMSRMLVWSRHAHAHVRRFSSEGCRPRLPWGASIPALKRDPSPILPVLENLKDDDSVFVRKSVANNLNDIAKDHPGIVTGLAKKWKGSTAAADWIIRHGCRGLLKKADPQAYRIFGLGTPDCEVNGLKLSGSRIRIGERLGFSFELKTKARASKLRLEYVIYYAKSDGKQSPKVFQLSEKKFPAAGVFPISREQRFQDFTTRKHYPGKHKLAIVVNGKEMAVKEFMVVK